MHDYKGKRIAKIRNLTELVDAGISLTSAAFSIRECMMFRGVYLGYNKKIDLTKYKKPQLRRIT